MEEWQPCLHNESIANLLVRDLDPRVHSVLVERAAASGQSLQTYVTRLLTEAASLPTLKEVLDQVEEWSGGNVGRRQAVDDLAAGRGER